MTDEDNQTKKKKKKKGPQSFSVISEKPCCIIYLAYFLFKFFDLPNIWGRKDEGIGGLGLFKTCENSYPSLRCDNVLMPYIKKN